MVDFPDQKGKMCDWKEVQVVEGAEALLKRLCVNHKIYVATNAAESSEKDILSVFQRVGLAPYISGYFCRENIGVDKSSPVFYQRILTALSVDASSVTMVGDSFNNDIQPAIEAGIDAIWLNLPGDRVSSDYQFRQVSRLSDI